MSIYAYSVRWFSEVDEKDITSSGIIGGNGIGDVTRRLVEVIFKGEEISSVTIHLLPCSCEGHISLTYLEEFLEKSNLIDE